MKRRGHSLVEMLVTLVLVGLLIVCIGSLVSAAARYYNHSTKSLELQESLLTACSRTATEISESNYTSLTVDDGPPACVVFITPRLATGLVSVDPVTGKSSWQRMVAYYTDTVNGVPCLVWKDRPIAPKYVPPYPTVPPAWDTAAEWMADGSRKRHIVASNITEFLVTATTPLDLQMTAQTPDGRYVLTVNMSVKPKN